jgi:hypothetical protein
MPANENFSLRHPAFPVRHTSGSRYPALRPEAPHCPQPTKGGAGSGGRGSPPLPTLPAWSFRAVASRGAPSPFHPRRRSLQQRERPSCPCLAVTATGPAGGGWPRFPPDATARNNEGLPLTSAPGNPGLLRHRTRKPAAVRAAFTVNPNSGRPPPTGGKKKMEIRSEYDSIPSSFLVSRMFSFPAAPAQAAGDRRGIRPGGHTALFFLTEKAHNDFINSLVFTFRDP